MKFVTSSAVGLLGIAMREVAGAKETTSPVLKVLELLNSLKYRIDGDGKREQQMYDKVACWCEETLARKAKDIADAKELIKELSAKILKLEAETATHKAEVAQLEKDIAANKQSQKEATAAREKSNAEYMAVKTEAEQSLGALEAAVGALTGAGEKKKTEFLSMHEAQLMSVAAGVRHVLSLEPVVGVLSDDDMRVVSHFVKQPTDFVRSSVSAVQTGANPFGDYAPKSGQIQGVLKGLYDAFAQNLEKANVEEAEAEKAFRELMATKAKELATLEEALEHETTSFAEKDEQKAMAKQLRDETDAQLQADEKFFAETKISCQDRAKEWSERSRLRVEELQGIIMAVKILGSDEAKKTFESAATTLLQEVSLQNIKQHLSRSGTSKALAVKLHKLASKFPRLAEIAMEAESTGHFDKVIVSIDKMIEDLRKEEAADIAHRDRCQNGMNANANSQEDLEAAIQKATDQLVNMDDKKSNLQDQLKALEEDIANTEEEMNTALKLRMKEMAEFKQALTDDTNAVNLLEQALAALGQFYKKNKISMAMSQVEQPEYTIDRDKMPEGPGPAKYEGRKSDSAPIIGMISMIKEDLEKEIKTSKEEEAVADADYKKEKAAMQATLDSQMSTKISTEKNLAKLEAKIEDVTTFKEARETDLASGDKEKGNLNSDCAWVATHFDSRRQKRKNEINGLVEAKNFLAGGGDAAPDFAK